MHFLPDVHVTCEVCKGRRYGRETLEVRYKGLDIAEVLDLTVEQARELFAAHPKIARVLDTIVDVGLGYITLGQSATTLSGGEAQRIWAEASRRASAARAHLGALAGVLGARRLRRTPRYDSAPRPSVRPPAHPSLRARDDAPGRPRPLSRELARRATGSTLYILDEPTTGLHFDDTKKLLAVLHTLVERGNTVVVIEHHLDVIKTADWVIDLGPEGGDGGGEVVAAGTPEEVARVKESYTGQYLARVLGLPQAKAS